MVFGHTQLGIYLNFDIRRLATDFPVSYFLHIRAGLGLAIYRTSLARRWYHVECAIALCLFVRSTLQIDDRWFQPLLGFKFVLQSNVYGTKFRTLFTIWETRNAAGLPSILIYFVVLINVSNGFFAIFRSVYNRLKGTMQTQMTWRVSFIDSFKMRISFWKFWKGTAVFLDSELVVEQQGLAVFWVSSRWCDVWAFITAQLCAISWCGSTCPCELHFYLKVCTVFLVGLVNYQHRVVC